MAGFNRANAQHLRDQRNQVYLDVAARNVFQELRERDQLMREELEHATSSYEFEMNRMGKKLETAQSEVAAKGMISEVESEVQRLKAGNGSLTPVEVNDPVYKDIEAMLKEQGMPNVEIRSVQKCDMVPEYVKAYEAQAAGKEERLLWFCSSVIDPRKVVHSKNGIDYRPFSGKLGRGLYGAEYAVYADSCYAFETPERTKMLLLFRTITGKPFDYRNATQKPSKDDNKEEPWPINKTSTYFAAPMGYDCVWAPPDALCKPCTDAQLGSVMKPLAPCRCFWTPAEYRPEAYNKTSGMKSVPIRRVSSPVFCIYPPRSRGRVALADGQSQARMDPKDLEPAVLALPLAVVEYKNLDALREPSWRRWVIDNVPLDKVAHAAVDDGTQEDNHGGGVTCLRAQVKAEEEYSAQLDAEFTTLAKEHKAAEKKLRYWESFMEEVKTDEQSLTSELSAAKEVADEVINLRHDLKASEKQVKKLDKAKHDLEKQDKSTRFELEKVQSEAEQESSRNKQCRAELAELRQGLASANKELSAAHVDHKDRMAQTEKQEQSTFNAMKNKLEKHEKDNADLRNKCLLANSAFFKKEQKDKEIAKENVARLEVLTSELARSKEEAKELQVIKDQLDKTKEEARDAKQLRANLKKAYKENAELLTKRRATGAPTDIKTEMSLAEKEVEKHQMSHCEMTKLQEEDPIYEEVESMLKAQGIPNVDIKGVYKTEMHEQYVKKYNNTAANKKQKNLWFGSGEVDPRLILQCENGLDYRQWPTFGRLGKGIYGSEYAVYPDACMAYENDDKIRSLVLFKAVVGKTFDFRNATKDSGKDDDTSFEHPLNKTATYWTPPFGYESVSMPESAICQECKNTDLGDELEGECTCPIKRVEYQPANFNSQQSKAKDKIPFRRRISSPIYCLSLPPESEKHHNSDGQSQPWGEKNKNKLLCDWDAYVMGLPIALVDYRNPDAAKEPPWRKWAVEGSNEKFFDRASSVGKILEGELASERQYMSQLEEDSEARQKLLKNAENRVRNWSKLWADEESKAEKHAEQSEVADIVRQELQQQREAAEEKIEESKEHDKKLKKEKKKLHDKVDHLEEELTNAREELSSAREELSEERSFSGDLGEEHRTMAKFKSVEQTALVEMKEERASLWQELETEEAAAIRYKEGYNDFENVVENMDQRLMIPSKVVEALAEASQGKNYEVMEEAVTEAEKALEAVAQRLDLTAAKAKLAELEKTGPAGWLVTQLLAKPDERTLDLRKKNIDDKLFAVLLKHLPKLKKLHKLMLNDNQISAEGGEMLLKALPQCQSIAEINLTGNKIGDANKKQLHTYWRKAGKDVTKFVIKDG